MSEGLVDLLEAIEIHEQKSDVAVVPPGVQDGHIEPVGQKGAIRQSGEHVVQREVAKGGKLLAPLGDVAKNDDEVSELPGFRIGYGTGLKLERPLDLAARRRHFAFER